MKEIQAIVRTLVAPTTRESVLATLVTVEGSSYRRPGARLLMLSDETRVGSISGGCLEEDVMARARRVLVSGKPETVVYDTTSENDLIWGVGLGCHGVVRVLVERLPAQPGWALALADNFAQRRPTPLAVVHDEQGAEPLGTRLARDYPLPAAPSSTAVFFDNVRPPTALFVFGAGDDAQPLVRLAKELGWHVTVADPRAAFATRERFPTADNLMVAAADQLVERASPGSDSLAVVMTHHYVHDVPVLRGLLRRSVAYLGVLGPKKRANRMLDDLAKEDVAVTAAMRDKLHAPVGLDLGADAPEQVALAIIAEMQATITGRNAQPLRSRTRPIHD
jgi:xanthine/CO dehydrogenase XdhC/CoxF family maturation factor